VKSLRKGITLLLLAVWPVAVIHCKLESISGLEFLKCASQAADDSDCQGDGCQTVEGASYKNPDQQPVLAEPFLVLGWAALLPTVDCEPNQVSLFVGPELPPELPRTWQFLSRAAPPVRAPSFVS